MFERELRNKLQETGLKVTPQRLAILEAVVKLHNHPTAEKVIEYIRQTYPNIAIGTVYKVLDTLVDHQLINRIKTGEEARRYDAVMDRHHHLYSIDSDRIEDYVDDELNEILDNYFQKKHIQGFILEDIKVQLMGKFADGKP